MAEIDRWQADGLVSAEQAGKLRACYASTAPAVPWGLLVFATAGAIVVGLGVILLFAYNWDEIPKFGKLALVFGAVIAAHTAGIRLLAREGWQAKLGEALTVLGTMFYGSGIWLVAQIYHIDEHYPNGFLFWALGALAMAWALRSTAQGLMATVLILIWGCSETFDFNNAQYWAVLLVVGGILPLAWRQRSALLLATALAVIQFLIAVNATYWGGEAHSLTTSLALGVVLLAAARWCALYRPDFGSGAGVMAFFGWGAFLVCAYLLSFHEAADNLLDWSNSDGSDVILAAGFGWSLFAAGMVAWILLARRALLLKSIAVPVEDWLLPIALVYCFGQAALGSRQWDLLIAWSFNLMLLGVAIMWMWRGCRESLLRPTVLGSVLLSFVVFARYFDLFDSMASRGVAFIILGGIFFAEAMYYRKVRRETGGGV